MAILGGAALLLFGPEQLPKIARRVGGVVREVQNTSQSFIREMERAADITEEKERAREAALGTAALPPMPDFPPPEAYVPGPDHHAPLDALHEGPVPPGHTLEPYVFAGHQAPALHEGPVPAEASEQEPVQESLLPREPAQPTMFDPPKA
jgi:Sec-independent protein translocase protein TatA